MKLKTITTIIMLAAALHTVYGQNVTDTLRNAVYFNRNHTSPDNDSIAALAAWTEPLQDRTKDITRINVYGYDAPDNGTQKANEFSEQRAANTADIIADLLGMTSEQELENIKIIPKGTDWNGLADALRKENAKWPKKALDITENTPLWIVKDGKVVDGKNAQLRNLNGGRTYEKLQKEIFPSLRRADIEIVLQKDASQPTVPMTVKEVQKQIPADIELLTENNIRKKENNPVKKSITKNILDIRTNLLLPAMNVGIVKAIGRHFSLEGSWYYPWIRPEWIGEYACIEALAATVGGRYWFNERDVNLNGHSIGLSVTGSVFDLGRRFRIHNWKLEEIDRMKGFQGESLGVNLDWLYSWPIGKTLRMEVCIGAGAIFHENIDYQQYDKGSTLLRDPALLRTRGWYFGPTKAELNLVIPINYAKK